MKLLSAIVAVISIGSAFANAEDASKQTLSAGVQQQLMAQLKSNPGVRGALAEAKRWAGGGKCDSLQLEESTSNSFKVYATCTNPGDPAEEAKTGVGMSASGQIHVSGTIYYGSKKNSPITIQIDKIEFAYAG